MATATISAPATPVDAELAPQIEWAFCSSDFCFPKWISRVIRDGVRSGRLSLPKSISEKRFEQLIELARQAGLDLDHPGRLGDKLTLELYEVDPAALDRFANLLDARWQNHGPSNSQWNGTRNPQGFGRTSLITFSPRRN